MYIVPVELINVVKNLVNMLVNENFELQSVFTWNDPIATIVMCMQANRNTIDQI